MKVAEAWRCRRFEQDFVGVGAGFAHDVGAPVPDHAVELAWRVARRRFNERRLRAGERSRFAALCVDEHLCGRERETTGFDRPARDRHAFEGTSDTHVTLRRAPAGPQARDEPRRGRQMPVAREDTSPVQLSEPTEAFELEVLYRLPQLQEVVLEPRVGEVGELLRSERFDRRTELAHRGCSPELVAPNMSSTVCHVRRGLRDRRHIRGTVVAGTCAPVRMLSSV